MKCAKCGKVINFLPTYFARSDGVAVHPERFQDADLHFCSADCSASYLSKLFYKREI